MHPIHAIAFAALAMSPFRPLPVGPSAQQIDVWSFGFGPTPIHLRAGQPVTLTLVNHSGSSHDFTAPAFFANARTVNGGPLPTEIDLGPHQTRTVRLVPERGTYAVHCSHFLHKQMGMRDTIIVD